MSLLLVFHWKTIQCRRKGWFSVGSVLVRKLPSNALCITCILVICPTLVKVSCVDFYMLPVLEIILFVGEAKFLQGLKKVLLLFLLFQEFYVFKSLGNCMSLSLIIWLFLCISLMSFKKSHSYNSLATNLIPVLS